MATAVPAGLSAREGRKFGLTVGGAFLVLGGLLWWRHRPAAPYLGGLGAALALAGLVVPTYLGPVQRGWMALAHAISRVTTPIFMAIVYFVVLTPIGLVRRAFGGSALEHRANEGSYWVTRPSGQAQAGMERQF